MDDISGDGKVVDSREVDGRAGDSRAMDGISGDGRAGTPGTVEQWTLKRETIKWCTGERWTLELKTVRR